MWMAAELQAVRLWQLLSQSWPVDLISEVSASAATGPFTQSDRRIQTHRGMATMAAEVSKQIVPHLKRFPGARTVHWGRAWRHQWSADPRCFTAGELHLAGHSMGGSLAQLVAVRLALNGARTAQQVTCCHTFGSPPVMAPPGRGPGSEVLAMSGMPVERFRNWVLDYDPVPRAMLSADPYYQMALQSQARPSALRGYARHSALC